MIVGMLLSALYFGLLPLGEFVPPASQTTYIMSSYALGVLCLHIYFRTPRGEYAK